MIADTDLNIIYMNESVKEMLSLAESDIRKELYNFNSATLMGANIDSFHKNPGHQRSMLAKLNNTIKAMMPNMGIRPNNSHQPDLSVSCKRLTLTAN